MFHHRLKLGALVQRFPGATKIDHADLLCRSNELCVGREQLRPNLTATLPMPTASLRIPPASSPQAPTGHLTSCPVVLEGRRRPVPEEAIHYQM